MSESYSSPKPLGMDGKEGTDLVTLYQEAQELKYRFRVQQDNMLQMQMRFNQKLLQQLMEEEKKELKEAFHQEIGELKQLVNQHESEKISELRNRMEEISASAEVHKEQRKKGIFERLFRR